MHVYLSLFDLTTPIMYDENHTSCSSTLCCFPLLFSSSSVQIFTSPCFPTLKPVFLPYKERANIAPTQNISFFYFYLYFLGLKLPSEVTIPLYRKQRFFVRTLQAIPHADRNCKVIIKESSCQFRQIFLVEQIYLSYKISQHGSHVSKAEALTAVVWRLHPLRTRPVHSHVLR